MRDLGRLLSIYRQQRAGGRVSERDAFLHAFNCCYLLKYGIKGELRLKCLRTIYERGLVSGDSQSAMDLDLKTMVRLSDTSLVFQGLVDT